MIVPAIRWRAIAAQLAVLMVLAASVPAATITWDADATTGDVADGGGDWLGADQWWNGTSHVTWTSGDDAVFGVGGTGGAVTLSAPTAAGSLTFDPFTGTYTLGTAGQALTLGSGGVTMNAGAGAVTLVSPVTLEAAQAWTNNSTSLLTTSATTTNGGHLLTVAGSGNATLAAVTGTGGLAKSGGGTLVLAGANTATGGVVVNGGTLTVQGSMAANQNYTISNGTLRTAATSLNVLGEFWTSGTVTLNAGGVLSADNASSNAHNVFNVVLAGGELAAGVGSITPAVANWYINGGITANGETTSTISASLGRTGVSGSPLAVTVEAGSTLNVTGPIVNIVWPKPLVKNGGGTLTLAGANTYSGGTTVNGGTLTVQGSMAANQNYTISNGTLRTAATSFNVLGWNWTSGTITLNAGGVLSADNASSNAHNVFNVVLAGGELAAGVGSITPAFANWYINGGITANGETTSTISASLGRTGVSGSPLAVTVEAGSTLNVTGPIVNIGGANPLVKTGLGTLALAAANTFTGATSISGGRLQVEPTGSFTATSGITLDGGELRYNSTTALARPLTLTAGTISGTGTIATPVSVASGGVLSPGNSPGTQAYSQGLTWNGGGTYLWEVNALSGTAGTEWDLLDVSGGTFDLSGLSAGSPFTLDLTTLTAADLPGPLAVPYDGGSYTFPIVSYTSLSSPLGTAALTDLTSLFTIQLDDWAAPKPGLGDISVRINAAADGIELVVVPEPAFAGAAALVAAGFTAWRIRRRPRTSP